MPRRLIDSSLSQSEKFNGGIPPDKPGYFARILYMLLIAHADRWGLGDANPFSVKMRVVPGFSESAADIQKALEALAEAGLILLYVVKGKQYYGITEWDAHQYFNEHNRTGNSKIPVATGRNTDNSSEQSETVGDGSPYNKYKKEVKKEVKKEIKKEIKDIYIVVFEHWNSKDNLITHKAFKGAIADRITRAVNGRLAEEHTKEDILSAIDNYDFVIGSGKHYYSHRWPLDVFLSRSKGFPMFVDAADPRGQFISGEGFGNKAPAYIDPDVK